MLEEIKTYLSRIGIAASDQSDNTVVFSTDTFTLRRVSVKRSVVGGKFIFTITSSNSTEQKPRKVRGDSLEVAVAAAAMLMTQT